MSDSVWMVAAFISALLGMAWLALAMDVHWKQIKHCKHGPSDSSTKILRVLGSLALTASLLFCLLADVPTMAALVWMMALTFGSMVIAFVLAWRPTLLRPLSFGFRGGR